MNIVEMWFALKAEIALPAYAGKTDAEIAAIVNAQTANTPRDFAADELREILIIRNEYADLQDISNNATATNAQKKKGRNLLALALGVTVRCSKPLVNNAFIDYVNTMGAAGIFSAASVTQCLALAIDNGPKWPQVFDAAAIAYARTFGG